MHEALDEIYKMPLHKFRPEAILGAVSPYYWASDEDINTIVTPTAPAAIHTGPITRGRARQLNYQVLSFLGNDSNVHENMMLPKLDTFVLLTNEGPSMDKRDEHWSKTNNFIFTRQFFIMGLSTKFSKIKIMRHIP